MERGEPGILEALRREAWPEAARVVALTGPPGVGKSVLANALGRELAAGADPGAVGIVAVDPTSPRSGGALLGDRVRVLGDDGSLFFRSMAARGADGGLAPGLEAVLHLVALSGRKRILVETVGAGQGEHAVTRLADLTVAVLAPGLGDAVQAAKAGLFEVSDLVVVNQADRPGAEATAALWRATRGAGEGPVLLVSGKEGTGVADLAAEIDRGLADRSGADRSRADRDRPGGPQGAPSDEDRSRLDRLREALGATRLDHVGIAVRDGDASAELWRSLLGLREVSRHRVDEFGVLALFLRPGGPAGAPASGLLELVQPTAPGTVTRFLERRGEGLHHVCFEVPDIHAALAGLAAAGVRLVDETPRRGAGDHLVAFVHPASTGGVLLELKQAEPVAAPNGG